jgi:sulfite exporter TauE/SafE
MSLSGVALFGFLLGMRHAFEADHVAAVASLSTRGRSVAEGLRMGVAWGIGHSVTLFIVGAVVLWIDGVVPERLAKILELFVGFMLVLLGLDVWRRLLRRETPFEPTQATSTASAVPLRALCVGLMHGMAGSAALVLLTLDRSPSVPAGLSFIAVFGVGSILGMALLSTAISVPLRLSARSMRRLHDGLQKVVATATILLGAEVIYHMSHAL